MNANRIELTWSPPMPDPVPGRRDDPGGYIYRIFRDGRLILSGSARLMDRAEDARPRVIQRAQMLATEKGLENLPIVILSDRDSRP